MKRSLRRTRVQNLYMLGTVRNPSLNSLIFNDFNPLQTFMSANLK